MKLWVNVCFYYVEERLEQFREVIKTLSDIPNIKLIINSNVNFDSNLPIHVAELGDPYRHTWEHKKYMSEFLESDYTHFAYLEGNIHVEKKTFDYWVKTRELFQRNNLKFIPAVHRVQKDKEGQVYSLDCTHYQRHRPTITVEEQKFISLSEPYQGMFIMDKELVKEHIESEYYQFGQKGSWGIRESANLGNMFVNIPVGFGHRCMLPLNNFSDTWVTHFGTDYHGDENSPHAKIKIEDLFR
jgi:hypothetical protein